MKIPREARPRITVTGDDGQVLGSCARVIELAAPMDGPPPVLTAMQVPGPVIVGHTFDADDPGEPILADDRDTVLPGQVAHRETRCGGCTTRVLTGRAGSMLVLVIEHGRGCGWLAAEMRRRQS